MRDNTEPSTLPALSLAPGAGKGPEFEAMEMPELQPGQYWTATRDQTFSKQDDEGRGVSGEWTVGRSYLVKDIKVVDGMLHTVVLHPHPLEDRQWGSEMLSRHFFAAFERDMNPEATRAREMNEVQDKIRDLNSEIAAGPPIEAVTTEAERLLIQAPPPASPGPGSGALAIQKGDIERAKERSAAMMAVAEKQSGWITQRADGVSAAAKKLTLFGKERAVAALASVQDVIRYAKRLEEGIETLGLYSGTGVIVTMLCDGPLAADDVPLSIFQRRLYMDEEHLVELADGGATWRNAKDFARALGKDEKLLNRIIPAERGIVCMRYRRRAKDLKPESEFRTMTEAFAAGMATAVEDARNAQTFLLIRDGRRVYEVWSEISTDDTPRLFPTSKEVDKPFVGWGFSDKEKRIDLEDIRFSEKLEESRRIQLHYRRLLILLWGLDDRENLLGLRRSGDMRKYTDLSFQAERFVFIHDDDPDRLFGTGKPNFRTWVQQQNMQLRSGSRVVCLWRQLMNSKTAPGCVKRVSNRGDGYDDVRLWPKGDSAILIARKDGDEYVVDVDVSGEKRGWSDDGRSETRRMKARVSLSAYDEDDVAFLVLDSVDPADLGHYLNSRLERQDYLSYIGTFTAAKKHLDAEIASEVPARDTLLKGLVAGGLGADERMPSVLSEAIRTWRSRNRGQPLPDPLDPEWNSAATAIYGFCWIALGRDVDLKPVAEQMANAAGRVPLRLVITGSNQVVLYATSTDEEKKNALGNWPWVARISCRRLRKAPWLAIDSVRQDFLPLRSSEEKSLAEWGAAAKWVGLADIDKIGIDGLEEIRAWMRSAIVQGPSFILPKGELVREAMTLTAELSFSSSKGSVARPDIVIPFAVIRKKPHPHSNPEGFKVLMLTVDAIWWTWKNGQPAAAEKHIRNIYRHPANHVDHLRGKKPDQWVDFGPRLEAIYPSALREAIRMSSSQLPNILCGSACDSISCDDEGPELALADMLRKGRRAFWTKDEFRKQRTREPDHDVIVLDEAAWALAEAFVAHTRRPPAASVPEPAVMAQDPSHQPLDLDDPDLGIEKPVSDVSSSSRDMEP